MRWVDRRAWLIVFLKEEARAGATCWIRDAIEGKGGRKALDRRFVHL
ncbi:hypothetical protein [Candidatus Methylacidithermus pantelleriae]|uniref:Uncharacterized protein n=1 Tax=Candidatus Methylacidithermus pantelleriae TaxID=2744239 RepID=A0A8J2BQN1_9BACT|nr:hypothetical protein [Candidatus Methylacidithermus pantelleriae]CAF0702391.1 hypothetical protein MPNT_50059 [Candidatus Methylacidithermus pantelleriae]